MRVTHILGILPFVGILIGVVFVNRATPYILGMPFLLFWIVMWVVLSSCFMAIVYRMDAKKKGGDYS